jgi:hypothetical protein
MHKRCWSGNLKGKYALGDRDIVWWIILKWILAQWWNFGFHKRPWIYWLCERAIDKCKLYIPGLNQLSTTPWRRMKKWRYSSTIYNLGGEWSGLRRCHFIPWETASGTHCTVGVMGARVGMEVIPRLICRPAHSLVVWAIPAHIVKRFMKIKAQ